MQVEEREYIVYNDELLREEVVTALVGGNTEACEQCFRQLRESSPTLRNLGPWAAQVLIAFRVHFMNEQTARSYVHVNPDMPPVQPQGPISRRWKPCQTLGPPDSL